MFFSIVRSRRVNVQFVQFSCYLTCFSTDTDPQHTSLNSACHSNIRVWKSVFLWKDWLYQSTQTHQILIGLHWTQHTYGLSTDISPAFVYFSFLCLFTGDASDFIEGHCWTYICAPLCQMLMDSNQMYFTLSCCSYCKKYLWAWRRGPILKLSFMSSCVCPSHRVVSCTFVCVYRESPVFNQLL